MKPVDQYTPYDFYLTAYADVASGVHMTPTPIVTEHAAARALGYRHARKDQPPDDRATLMTRIRELLT